MIQFLLSAVSLADADCCAVSFYESQNIYCRDCFERHINNTANCNKAALCPDECRKPVTLASLRPHQLSSKDKALRLACVNADAGCEEVVALHDIAAHEKRCKWATVRCAVPGCPQKVSGHPPPLPHDHSVLSSANRPLPNRV